MDKGNETSSSDLRGIAYYPRLFALFYWIWMWMIYCSINAIPLRKNHCKAASFATICYRSSSSNMRSVTYISIYFHIYRFSSRTICVRRAKAKAKAEFFSIHPFIHRIFPFIAVVKWAIREKSFFYLRTKQKLWCGSHEAIWEVFQFESILLWISFCFIFLFLYFFMSVDWWLI